MYNIILSLSATGFSRRDKITAEIEKREYRVKHVEGVLARRIDDQEKGEPGVRRE